MSLTRRDFLKLTGASFVGIFLGVLIGDYGKRLTKLTGPEEAAWITVGYESWPGKEGRYEWYQEPPPS